MGNNRNNYTRYSKEPIKTTEASVPVEPVEVVKVDEPVEPVVVVEEPKIVAPKKVMGVVTDCTRLNVREHPDKNARVVDIIDASTELTVIEKDSTKDFYKIRTSFNLEGYCMKRYITILP